MKHWLVIAALLTACPDEPDPIVPDDCSTDPRATALSPELAVESSGGLFTVRLAATSPPTPDVGNNVWELSIESSTTATARVKWWMPDHGHGTRPLWHDAALLPVSGLHRVGPFDLWMPGLWEATIEGTIGGVTDEARIALCIQDRIADTDAGVTDASMPVECNVTAPTACTGDLTYQDIEPIIASRCLGCHNGATENWPLTTYDHVADWYSEIRGMMISCAMPPPESGIPMTDEEREQILLWIRCGHPPD